MCCLSSKLIYSGVWEGAAARHRIRHDRWGPCCIEPGEQITRLKLPPHLVLRRVAMSVSEGKRSKRLCSRKSALMPKRSVMLFSSKRSCKPTVSRVRNVWTVKDQHMRSSTSTCLDSASSRQIEGSFRLWLRWIAEYLACNSASLSE